MAKFRPRDNHELSKLDDEKLLRYIALAQIEGTPEHVQEALSVIVFRHYDLVRGRVRIKLAGRPADVEDVVQNAMLSAIRSRLDGRSVGEFKSWLHTIASRRIADYWRSHEDDPPIHPLAGENAGDEEVWGDEPAEGDRTGAIEVREIAVAALEELSPPHRRVIELFVWEGYSAAETCDQVNSELPGEDTEMKADNVSKIKERFRKRLRELLEEADRPPDDADNPSQHRPRRGP